jgi:hypothetical protein
MNPKTHRKSKVFEREGEKASFKRRVDENPILLCVSFFCGEKKQIEGNLERQWAA